MCWWKSQLNIWLLQPQQSVLGAHRPQFCARTHAGPHTYTRTHLYMYVFTPQPDAKHARYPFKKLMLNLSGNDTNCTTSQGVASWSHIPRLDLLFSHIPYVEFAFEKKSNQKMLKKLNSRAQCIAYASATENLLIPSQRYLLTRASVEQRTLLVGGDSALQCHYRARKPEQQQKNIWEWIRIRTFYSSSEQQTHQLDIMMKKIVPQIFAFRWQMICKEFITIRFKWSLVVGAFPLKSSWKVFCCLNPLVTRIRQLRLNL